MLQVKSLNYKVKNAGGSFAIKDVSFDLEDGYMMCLLGRNAAGKTTLLDMIYGMITQDSGEVLWQGRNVWDNLYEFHKHVAYIGDSNWCFTEKGMDENVAVLSLLYDEFDQKLYDEYIRLFGLTEADRKQAYSDLSTGQKRQFQLAFSLARRPNLMILDEPLANLDPVIKVDLMELLHRKAMEDNMGILISTHLVEDISDMVDFIGIMDDGEMKIFGDRESVFETFNSESLRELLLDMGRNKA
jgi:ABC-2 type transport system ATP-binding protein